MAVDIERLRTISARNDRYDAQLKRLEADNKQTSCIEEAVNKAVDNVVSRKERSFVIYGEPQSGKTEMMICLTAKLLDSGSNVVVHLLNDSVQLLQQNLDRFQRSGLAPAAKNFSDVMDPSISLRGGQHVIFCKKNGHDLKRLVEKLESVTAKVIVDDEADFATPNAKINRGDVTRINNLVGQLIGNSGTYIGVTATPARLDLNNTFNNNNEIWVNFPPHNAYTGQDIFFPLDAAPTLYHLVLLPDAGDAPKFLREALYRFLAHVAAINTTGAEENYSMLIHTSGMRIDHRADRKPIDDVFQALRDVNTQRFAKAVSDIEKIAIELYGAERAKELIEYIVENKDRYNVIIMNSERDKNTDFKSATSPSSLFTIIIGGNIVSRGVTFDNLLSMYFTRDAKHKLQQDTYIQRARMFGSRKKYLKHFELTIPNHLFADWHRCFVFHKLALEAIRAGLGSPVWLGNKRIAVAATPSIDRANVAVDRGEMSFRLFDYDSALDQLVAAKGKPIEKLRSIQRHIGDAALPDYLIRYVQSTMTHGDLSIGIHEPTSIAGYAEAEGLDKDRIERKRGFFGRSQREKFPQAVHHFAFFYNAKNKARLIYRFVGDINFIKNLKHV